MFREIRRKDRLMPEAAAVELLEKCETGVLSVLGDDDYPYGVPVNFAYKGGRVYIHAFLEGHKIDAIQKHPKVCFTAIEGAEVMKEQIATNYTSVIAFGKAKVIPPPENELRKTAFAAIISKYIPNEEARTSEYIKENEKSTTVIVMEIEHMTCKKRDIR